MLGIERIKILGSEVKDKALLKVIEYLVSREDMNEKYLNEEKSLKQMVEYIKSEAKKQAVNGMAMIEDEEVYGWAIHYFDETNEKLGLKVETKNIIKPLEKSIKEAEEMEKGEVSKEEITLRVARDKNVPEGQLTLF